jgi:hypothetical protein
LIDERLRIEDSDVLVGVFRGRFGTPVSDADSGTEHEIRRAIGAWRTKGAPQVMLYFGDAPYQPACPADEEQFRKVQKFKQDLISTDKLLVWAYRDVADFSDCFLKHLLNVVMQQLQPRLDGIGPRETRIFQIGNLRCAPCSGFSFVIVYATITGAPIADAQQKIATIGKGLDFEARTADNSGRLADGGFETRRSADLIERRIATLRFTEGFPNAFKSRAPIPGLIWNTYEGDAVSTGESQSCPVFATVGGAGRVSGLADYGTCLQAKFSDLQPGVRIFVSERELGFAMRARLLTWESTSSPGNAMTIGGLEVRELPTQDGGALAVWEVVTPFFEPSASLLDVAVFASYVSEPAANLPSLGTSHVAGSFSPVVAGYGGSGPVPQFISNTQGPPRNVLTIVP